MAWPAIAVRALLGSHLTLPMTNLPGSDQVLRMPERLCAKHRIVQECRFLLPEQHYLSVTALAQALRLE